MTVLSEQEKQMRLNRAVYLAKRMREILDGEKADVIHMALGTVVASYAMVIDPVGFPDAVKMYAHHVIKDGKPVQVQ